MKGLIKRPPQLTVLMDLFYFKSLKIIKILFHD